MQPLPDYQVAHGRAVYRPRGSASAGQLADLITAALERARTDAVRTILVNISDMTGFESPGPAFRRWAARRWAQALGPNIPLAMVAHDQHICPRKTGLLVAAEEGVNAHICTSEHDALAWLDSASPASSQSTHAAHDRQVSS